MLRIDRVITPWKESGALNSQINLYGFWNEHTFIRRQRPNAGSHDRAEARNHRTLVSLKSPTGLKSLNPKE
jgi:hypothetical protein